MEDTTPAIKNLRQILSQKVIPHVQSLRMILAQRPLRVPPDVCVTRRPAPSLQTDKSPNSRFFLAQYKKEAMHAIRFPYFCFVLEGEIDMRLGIPPQHGKALDKVNHYHILTLPAHTFLLIPSGVLYPDASQAHWERAPLPPVNSRLFWMRILPTGAFCHTSTTTNTQYSTDHRDTFVPDLQMATLSEMLIEELQSMAPDADAAAQSLLLLLLLRVRRGLAASAPSAGDLHRKPIRSTPAFQKRPLEISHSADMNSAIIERACAYIRTHLDAPLAIKEIAAHAHISPSYLSQLFRTERKITVMKYVLEQRLEIAQSMLINTDIPVQEIAGFIGYQQTPQFNRFFRQAHHTSPTEFRRRHRNEQNNRTSAKR